MFLFATAKLGQKGAVFFFHLVFLVDEIKICITPKLFSDVSIALGQIHIYKTSIKTELAVEVWPRHSESQRWTQLIHVTGSQLRDGPFRLMEREMLGSCFGNTLEPLQKSTTFQSSPILIFISKQSLSSQGFLLELTSCS